MIHVVCLFLNPRPEGVVIGWWKNEYGRYWDLTACQVYRAVCSLHNSEVGDCLYQPFPSHPHTSPVPRCTNCAWLQCNMIICMAVNTATMGILVYTYIAGQGCTLVHPCKMPFHPLSWDHNLNLWSEGKHLSVQSFLHCRSHYLEDILHTLYSYISNQCHILRKYIWMDYSDHHFVAVCMYFCPSIPKRTAGVCHWSRFGVKGPQCGCSALCLVMCGKMKRSLSEYLQRLHSYNWT